MKTGLIGLKFKDSISAEEIEEVISNFYGENNTLITGMQYLEFRDPKTLEKVFKFIEKDDVVDSMEAGKV